MQLILQMSIERIHIWSYIDEFDSIYNISDCHNTTIIDCNGVSYDLSRINSNVEITLEKYIDNFITYEKILRVWVSKKDPRKLKLDMGIRRPNATIYNYGSADIEKLLCIEDTQSINSYVNINGHTINYQEFLSLDILVTDIMGNSYTPDDLVKRSGEICINISNIMGVDSICILCISTFRGTIRINLRQTNCGCLGNFYSYDTFLKMFQRKPQPKSARNI
jgi:hypothetical protein